MNAALRWLGPCLIVAMISAGQILFKYTANMLRDEGRITLTIAGTAITSILVYGLATVGWIWMLQYYKLSSIYPIMALSFVLVPLGSWLLFSERLSVAYAIGTVLLFSGLFVIFVFHGQGAE